jgi:glycolate oxidase iron-sulfur subunit
MTCTRCGLCLESCPTYTLWGAEPDSPRGRIALLEDALGPGGRATAELGVHLDRCLGCMACMSVCPEDVPYPDLLAAGRALLQREVARPMAERLHRAAALTALPRAGPGGPLRRGTLPHHTPAQGEPRGRLGLLLGCQRATEQRDLNADTAMVLSAEGFEVIAPRLSGCCGALELHGGLREHALARAQQTMAAFAAVGGVDHIIANTAGCGAALKDYGRLLGTAEARVFSSLVLDVHELLTAFPLRSQLAPLALRAAFHEACQLQHGQRAGEPPRRLMARIPGLELVDLPAAAGACCGAPGIYRIVAPEPSAELGRRQARAVMELGVQAILSTDSACIEQLRRHLRGLGRPLPVHHPVQVLARSIEAGRQPS